MDKTQEPRASELFMSKFLEERAAVRKLQHDGECTGEDRPRCYSTCEHAAYCSEWRYTMQVPF